MKIDYVIIASDENPTYKDFYPLVAKRWNSLGFKTYFVNICDEDDKIETKWGIIHKIKALDFCSTGFQSQVVRLFSSKFIDGNLLMSDIDMFPINGEYYNQYLNELNDENVLIYSGQPYVDVPYYPMCYIVSKSKNLIKYLELENMNFEDYCKYLLANYKEAWNTDENFMYDKFQKHTDKLVIKKRDFTKRVDRGNWKYDVNLLKDGFYIDSHLLRPLNEYSKQINELINNLKPAK